VVQGILLTNGEDLGRSKSEIEAGNGRPVWSRCRQVVRQAWWTSRGVGGVGVHGLGVEVIALLLAWNVGRMGGR
jgi:hypothetical protein